jgi:EpsI family protein
MNIGPNKAAFWRFWLLVAVLLCTGIAIHWLERGGETRIERKPLREFPIQLGQWKQIGGEQRFDSQVEEVLRADDYMVRDYISANGKTANLYIGYYSTQRTGATYHSPLNCLPGSGWTMTEPARIKINVQGGKEFEANRYVIQNEGKKFALIYWYQGRGRAVASEYWDKLYTIIDSMTQRRSDGSMVRIMMSLEENERETMNSAAEFASQIASPIPAFIPN